jgi:hypothetical protein
MKVLVACEFSGVVRDAFIRRGHDAWSCDLMPSESNHGPHIIDDVLNILSDGWEMIKKNAKMGDKKTPKTFL